MTTRIALVGDRSPHVVAHTRIPAIIAWHPSVEAYWIATDEVAETDLAGFDGVWAVPGSPYVSEEGVLSAIGQARESGQPFLGTCGGFQHAVLEFARSVAGRPGAWHAENREAEPDAEALVVPLACSLVGHESEVDLVAGTRAAEAVGSLRRRERFHCGYGLVAGAERPLEAAGLVVSGRDGEGAVRVVELPDHPFFVATLFQPELADDQPHPLVAAFLAAVG